MEDNEQMEVVKITSGGKRHIMDRCSVNSRYAYGRTRCRRDVFEWCSKEGFADSMDEIDDLCLQCSGKADIFPF